MKITFDTQTTSYADAARRLHQAYEGTGAPQTHAARQPTYLGKLVLEPLPVMNNEAADPPPPADEA